MAGLLVGAATTEVENSSESDNAANKNDGTFDKTKTPGKARKLMLHERISSRKSPEKVRYRWGRFLAH